MWIINICIGNVFIVMNIVCCNRYVYWKCGGRDCWEEDVIVLFVWGYSKYSFKDVVL